MSSALLGCVARFSATTKCTIARGHLRGALKSNKWKIAMSLRKSGGIRSLNIIEESKHPILADEDEKKTSSTRKRKNKIDKEYRLRKKEKEQELERERLELSAKNEQLKKQKESLSQERGEMHKRLKGIQIETQRLTSETQKLRDDVSLQEFLLYRTSLEMVSKQAEEVDVGPLATGQVTIGTNSHQHAWMSETERLEMNMALHEELQRNKILKMQKEALLNLILKNKEVRKRS